MIRKGQKRVKAYTSMARRQVLSSCSYYCRLHHMVLIILLYIRRWLSYDCP